MRKIKGVGFMLANAIVRIADIDDSKTAGQLSDEEVKKLNDTTKDYKKFPVWMLNRRRDFETGEDTHIITSDLKLRKEFDIKRLQRLKTYRGMRHSFGLPVRGQRTRAHFRKGKAVGVQRKAAKIAQGKKK